MHSCVTPNRIAVRHRLSPNRIPVFTARVSGFASMMSLFVSLMLGCLSPAFALDPVKSIDQYGHVVWMRENGLPVHAVNVAVQGREGYLWIGTSAGLFRFDGVRFEEVFTNPKDANVHESITALQVCADSSLWIGTGFNGVRKLNHGKMTMYGAKGGFHNTQVRQLSEVSGGGLVIGTSNGAFLHQGDVFRKIVRNPNFITGVTEDEFHRIWIGAQDGIRVLEHADTLHAFLMTEKDGLPSNMITCLYTDRNANVWIGTINGLACWKNGKITNFTGAGGMSGRDITAIYLDRNDNLWVGTRTGLYRLSHGRWSAYTETDGLSDNSVLSITEDREGSLWVCTSNGLNQFRDVTITAYTTKSGLPNDFISGVAETPDGSIYFLSDRGARVSRMKDTTITVTSTVTGPACVSKDGSFWIAHQGGLIRMNRDKTTFYDTTNGIPNKWISAIGEDATSLVIGVDHMGLCRFADGHLTPYLLGNGQEFKSIEFYISCFLTEANGTLWMGTSDGLFRFRDGKSTQFRSSDGMADQYVSSLCLDPWGRLWISSPLGGLTKYADGKFTVYGHQVGLFTNEINCVLADNRGDIWLSTPRGIERIRKSELDGIDAGRQSVLHSQVFTTADGMKTETCFGGFQPAGWKAHDGRLWFASKKGALVIDPEALTHNDLPPPVYIEKAVFNDVSLPVDQAGVVSPGSEKFEFHYTALSFAVPARVLFKYKLEGYDRDWVDAGTLRSAYYTNLSPGRYTFRVIACNNDGVWNKTGAAYSFDLQPHFYQAYWFYCLVILAFGGMIFGAYRLRIRQLIARERELDARIKEARANIKTLGKLLPICSKCKKIRDDDGYWDRLEGYIQTHSEAIFSHGVCPDCAEQQYGEYYARIKHRLKKDEHDA